jgi:ferritin
MAGLSDTLREALTNQAKIELETYLKYTQAAHWFELRHLSGIASFYKVIYIPRKRLTVSELTSKVS